MLMAISDFERLFRRAAGLDVDKDDLKRLSDFIRDKIYDLLVVGEAHAKANARDIIWPADLPITKGLQDLMHEFEEGEEAPKLQPILDQLAGLPALDLEIGEETHERLPIIAGALVIALARCFRVMEPELKNPETPHWEKAMAIFNLLL